MYSENERKELKLNLELRDRMKNELKPMTPEEYSQVLKDIEYKGNEYDKALKKYTKDYNKTKKNFED